MLGIMKPVGRDEPQTHTDARTYKLNKVFGLNSQEQQQSDLNKLRVRVQISVCVHLIMCVSVTE